MRAHALAHALALAALATASPSPVVRRSLPAVDIFLSEVLSVFPVSVGVADACGIISASSAVAVETLGIPDNADDGCGDVQLIFARGTCEPGNMGVFTGPWFAQALQEAMGERTLSVQGLDYPATVEDYISGSSPNGDLLVSKIKSTLAACPNSKMVLSGYSQGGQVVHLAMDRLDSASAERVVAIVLFGDPLSQEPVANIDSERVLIVCHETDEVCDHGIVVTPDHVTYSRDAGDAAAFVMQWI